MSYFRFRREAISYHKNSSWPYRLSVFGFPDGPSWTLLRRAVSLTLHTTLVELSQSTSLRFTFSSFIGSRDMKGPFHFNVIWVETSGNLRRKKLARTNTAAKGENRAYTIASSFDSVKAGRNWESPRDEKKLGKTKLINQSINRSINQSFVKSRIACVTLKLNWAQSKILVFVFRENPRRSGISLFADRPRHILPRYREIGRRLSQIWGDRRHFWSFMKWGTGARQFRGLVTS